MFISIPGVYMLALNYCEHRLLYSVEGNGNIYIFRTGDITRIKVIDKAIKPLLNDSGFAVS